MGCADAGGKFPDVGEALPEMGEVSSDVGGAFPDLGERSPTLGSVPRPWGAFPDLGERSPEIGETFPDVGEVSPDVGETLPEMGETSPNVREELPDVGASSPDVGETVPNVREVFPEMGAVSQGRNRDSLKTLSRFSGFAVAPYPRISNYSLTHAFGDAHGGHHALREVCRAVAPARRGDFLQLNLMNYRRELLGHLNFIDIVVVDRITANPPCTSLR